MLIELPSGSFYMFICCPFFSKYTEYIMLAPLITRFEEWQTSLFSYFLPLFAVASLQQSRMIIFSSSHTYCIMWQRGFSPCRSQRWRIHVARHNASIIHTQHGYFSRLCSKSSLKYVTFLLNANHRSKCYYDSYSTFIFIHLFMQFKVAGTAHIHNISIMPHAKNIYKTLKGPACEI